MNLQCMAAANTNLIRQVVGVVIVAFVMYPAAAAAGDAEVLLEFKRNLAAPGAANLSTWNVSGSSPCSGGWRGVGCDPDTGRVTSLSLTSLNLTGQIVPALGNLTALTFLNLSDNTLSGHIPSQLSNLANLQILDLSRNNFSGSVPQSFSSLKNLRQIQLHHNPALSGQFPVQLTSLPKLTHLCFGTNNLSGPIPPQIANLSSSLQHVALYENPLLSGPLPAELGQLSNLHTLKLFNLNLSGARIPPEIGNLTFLQGLYLFSANLSGSIPSQLGDLHNLTKLSLFDNRLTGSIPSSLGRLSKVQDLSLSHNALGDHIPPQLGNLTSLQTLYLDYNNFYGGLAAELGRLSSLQTLSIIHNQFNESIPPQLGNVTRLTEFYASANAMTGKLPPELGNLKSLHTIGLGGNRFDGSEIPPEFGSMQNLEELELSDVLLSGTIPSTLGNLTNLSFLRLSDNFLHGSLPSSLSNCTQLKWLKLENNSLSGQIPDGFFTSLHNLHTLSLHHNYFTGTASVQLSELSNNTVVVDIGHNSFSGRLPDTWAAMANVSVMSLGYNRFEGTIPDWIWNLSQLQMLDLSNNAFRGTISPHVDQLRAFQNPVFGNGSLTYNGSDTLWNDDVTLTVKGNQMSYYSMSLYIITSLDLSNNNLVGEIPDEIGNLRAMINLNLSRNALNGSIPTSISKLVNLESLDLSNNSLCGYIPSGLTNISRLPVFNVSYNARLSGQIPQGGQFSTFQANSYIENPNLCGEPLPQQCNGTELNLCSSSEPMQTNQNSSKTTVMIVSTCVSIAVLIIAALVALWLYCRYKMIDQGDQIIFMEKNLIEIKPELVRLIQFGCNENNRIGSGGSSNVYKFTLSNSQAVAVKILQLRLDDSEAKRSFKQESKILGRVKHRNIVKLLAVYISQPNDGIVACIFEFVPNGSLDEHLHEQGKYGERPLSWDQRLNIAIGVAEGIRYLHHENGYGQILHLDLKPSNILLDADMEPCICDFGISKLKEKDHNFTTVTAFRGTIGYAAPECAYSQSVSEKADVYSFGMVLLEMLTSKRPTWTDNPNELQLRDWVLSSNMKNDNNIDNHQTKNVLKWSSSVLDNYLRISEMSAKTWNQVEVTMRVALLCTLQEVGNRPSINEALDMLLKCCRPPNKVKDINDLLLDVSYNTEYKIDHPKSSIDSHILTTSDESLAQAPFSSHKGESSSSYSQSHPLIDKSSFFSR